jgi:hypothetical protein
LLPYRSPLLLPGAGFAEGKEYCIIFQEEEVLEMIDNYEKVLTETLGKAVTIVNTVDERYRDSAFPIILQVLVGDPKISGMRVQADGHQQHAEETKLSPSMSVNEFFRKAKPDTHPARFVCAGYYLLHTGKAVQFTIPNILEIYGKLREPKPKNPSDVMNQCVRKAYIIDGQATIEKQKTWVITSEGDNFVEGLLSDNYSSND